MIDANIQVMGQMIRKMIGHSNNHLAWINIKIKIKDESIYTYRGGGYMCDVSIYTMIKGTWQSKVPGTYDLKL